MAYLDEALLDRPQVALAAARRKVMRLADHVEIMQRETILTFQSGGDMTMARGGQGT
jgi:Na+/phosphate symporter